MGLWDTISSGLDKIYSGGGNDDKGTGGFLGDLFGDSRNILAGLQGFGTFYSQNQDRKLKDKQNQESTDQAKELALMKFEQEKELMRLRAELSGGGGSNDALQRARDRYMSIMDANKTAMAQRSSDSQAVQQALAALMSGAQRPLV